MMKKRSKKISLNLMTIITLACALLMIVACFLPFMSYSTTVLGNESVTTTSGMDFISELFAESQDVPDWMRDEKLEFGAFAVELGGFASIVTGGAILVLIAIAFLLGKGGKIFFSVSKLVALVAAVLSVLALIGGIILTNADQIVVGSLLKTSVSLGFGLILFVVGGIGSLISSIMSK